MYQIFPKESLLRAIVKLIGFVVTSLARYIGLATVPEFLIFTSEEFLMVSSLL